MFKKKKKRNNGDGKMLLIQKLFVTLQPLCQRQGI